VLLSLRFAQADAGSPTILRDELDAGLFEGGPHVFERTLIWLSRAPFKVRNCLGGWTQLCLLVGATVSKIPRRLAYDEARDDRRKQTEVNQREEALAGAAGGIRRIPHRDYRMILRIFAVAQLRKVSRPRSHSESRDAPD
jgi:hypothetical protein